MSVDVKDVIAEEAKEYARELGLPVNKVWSNVIVRHLQTKKKLRSLKRPKRLSLSRPKKRVRKSMVVWSK